MMFLAIDIGNTGTKFGLFKQDESFEMTFHFPTASIIADENIKTELLPKIAALGTLDSIIIASVVPKASEALTEILACSHEEAKIKVLKNSDVPIVNTYHTPEQVGIDRLLSSLAAYRMFGKEAKKPLIVISLGTATTIDCVNADGEYLGGIITLGVESSAKYLHHIAAQLPEIDLAFPKNILGKTTTESIQSGIMNGAIAMIEGLVQKLHQENFAGKEVIVITTGGLSEFFKGKVSMINHLAPHLVLEGIAFTVSKQFYHDRTRTFTHHSGA